MTADSFVSPLVEVVHDSSVDGTLATLVDPPGRKPGSRLVKLSA